MPLHKELRKGTLAGILRDSPPLAVALVGAMAVMLTTIPLAHGLGPKSMAAMAGTAVSLGLIVALAIIFADLAHLTGVSSEEAAPWLPTTAGSTSRAS